MIQVLERYRAELGEAGPSWLNLPVTYLESLHKGENHLHFFRFTIPPEKDITGLVLFEGNILIANLVRVGDNPQALIGRMWSYAREDKAI